MPMYKPLVSAIMPAYNHEKYVEEAIQSIINSSYENIELIVIDDGSKDSTWQKISDMKEVCDKRFVNTIFETKANGGTCETLNLMLEKAKGEYIFFIASDDMVKPQTIEKQVAFLANNSDYALVVANSDFIDADSRICYWDKQRNNIYDIESANSTSFGQLLREDRKDVDFLSDDFGSYSSLIEGNYITNGYLVRKSIFNTIGYFTKEAPLEDYWLMLQISKYAKMKYIDEILFSYRWHGANTVRQSEKMKKLTAQTLAYESKIVSAIDLKKCLPDIKEVLSQGRIVKQQSILGIVKITKSKTLLHTIKSIEFFGITLSKKQKDRF